MRMNMVMANGYNERRNNNWIVEFKKKRISGCVNIISYVTIERFVYRLK